MNSFGKKPVMNALLMTALLSTSLALSATPKALAVGTAVSNAELGQAAAASSFSVVNIARNKAVTTNAETTSNQPLSALTDGVTTRDKYVLYSVATGPKWAQVDLGRAYGITRLNIRSDWGSSASVYRSARDVVVQLSNDPGFTSGVVTVFNNDGDNSSGLGFGTDAEYLEPADGSGKDINLAEAVNARYVRFWANGHIRVNGQLNLVNTPVEIEVYADPEDTEPPAPVGDLAVTGSTMNEVELRWKAPGNDGSVGTAFQYDVRYATEPIKETSWASALQAPNEPVPMSAGTAQRLVVEGLKAGTKYYFALKTRDFAYESALSNVATVTTPAVDTVAPAATADLKAGNAIFRSAQLTWTAPGNDGSLGNAAKYEVRYATSPITEASWSSAVQAEDELPQRPVGSAMQFKVTELTPGRRITLRFGH
ncbi:discoidin domain-containing protein [Paenibacillus sp. CC-CFT747]|nr:discoidin domain-containing protein [Paenibacillus sp. CC-CFT747]